MSNNAHPVGPDAAICKVLTCLPEKFVVDFANGIDVTRDQLRVQKSRTVFFDRLYDGFTGKSARRQAEINASLADGVEASLKWLCELSAELGRSNEAIERVNDRVSAIVGNVTVLAKYSVDTRQQLERLSRQLGGQIDAMGHEVRRIDFVQKARINLDQVMRKWKAGRFGELSPAGRGYAALEELRWGAFGDYCRKHSGRERDAFMQEAIDHVAAQLADDANANAGARLDTRAVWLASPSAGRPDSDMEQALGYLADGFNDEAAPFVTSIVRMPREWPLQLPVLSSATRIAEAVTVEVFPESFDA